MTKIEDLDLDTLKFVAKRIRRIHNSSHDHHLRYQGCLIPKTLTTLQMIDVLVARRSGKRDTKMFSKELIEMIIDDKKFN